MANLEDLEFYELVTWQESIDKCYFSTAKTIGDYLVDGPKASCSVIGSYASGFDSVNTRRATDIRDSSGALLDSYPTLQKCALYFNENSVPEPIQNSTIEEFCEYYNSNYPIYVGTKDVRIAIRDNTGNHYSDCFLEGLYQNTAYHGYIPEDVEVGAFRVWGNNTIGNDGGHTIKSMGLAANVPIFENYNDATDYINGIAGAIEKAINYGGTESDVNPTNKTHTWRQVLHRVNANGSNDTIVGYKNVVVTTTSVGRVAAYYSDFNTLLNVKNKASGVISITYNEDGVEHTYTNIEDINDKLTWTEQNGNFIKDGNYYYWSRVNKYNWPIFGNVDDTEAYIDRSIDADDEKPTKINPTGTEKENQTDDLNNNTSSNTLSRLYVMDKSSMYDVADALYDTNTGSGSIVDTIKKGLQMYGNNPIEFIIDIYYTPIDVNEFINYTTVEHVQLGAYSCNVDGRCQYVGYNGNLKQLFSTFIYEDYYDFRDYQTDYYLYLPFIGIFQLPTSQVIGRLVTVKVAYDLRSHNMKYYIFSDGKLILTKEGSLGIQFPITYSDQVGKANQNIAALSSLANNAISLPSSVATGNMQGALSSMTDIFNSTTALYDRAKIGTSGNASSAAAAYDILYPYLIIDRPEYIKPSNLESQYNLPCNRIDKLSTCKGWTVCDDVKLEIDCLPEEKDMIENMLRSGVKF